MAGDLGTPDIGGAAKSSSLYVVSQLAIGNQRREPASKKVRSVFVTTNTGDVGEAPANIM
jgi:hypothetical protein